MYQFLISKNVVTITPWNGSHIFGWYLFTWIFLHFRVSWDDRNTVISTQFVGYPGLIYNNSILTKVNANTILTSGGTVSGFLLMKLSISKKNREYMARMVFIVKNLCFVLDTFDNQACNFWISKLCSVIH